MSKLLWHTVTVKIPSEMVDITKDGKISIKKTLTKLNGITKSQGYPAIKLIKSHDDKVHIINKGKKWNIEQLQTTLNKSNKLAKKNKNRDIFKSKIEQPLKDNKFIENIKKTVSINKAIKSIHDEKQIKKELYNKLFSNYNHYYLSDVIHNISEYMQTYFELDHKLYKNHEIIPLKNIVKLMLKYDISPEDSLFKNEYEKVEKTGPVASGKIFSKIMQLRGDAQDYEKGIGKPKKESTQEWAKKTNILIQKLNDYINNKIELYFIPLIEQTKLKFEKDFLFRQMAFFKTLKLKTINSKEEILNEEELNKKKKKETIIEDEVEEYEKILHHYQNKLKEVLNNEDEDKPQKKKKESIKSEKEEPAITKDLIYALKSNFLINKFEEAYDKNSLARAVFNVLNKDGKHDPSTFKYDEITLEGVVEMIITLNVSLKAINKEYEQELKHFITLTSEIPYPEGVKYYKNKLKIFKENKNI